VGFSRAPKRDLGWSIFSKAALENALLRILISLFHNALLRILISLFHNALLREKIRGDSL